MSGCRGVVRPYKVPAASRIPMNFVQVCSCSGSRHTVAMSTHAHTHAHVRAHTHTHTKRGEPTLSVQVRREIIVAHTGTAGYREKNLQDKTCIEAQSKRVYRLQYTESNPCWGWFWVWDQDYTIPGVHLQCRDPQYTHQ